MAQNTPHGNLLTKPNYDRSRIDLPSHSCVRERRKMELTWAQEGCAACSILCSNGLLYYLGHYQVCSWLGLQVCLLIVCVNKNGPGWWGELPPPSSSSWRLALPSELMTFVLVSCSLEHLLRWCRLAKRRRKTHFRGWADWIDSRLTAERFTTSTIVFRKHRCWYSLKSHSGPGERCPFWGAERLHGHTLPLSPPRKGHRGWLR